MPHMANLPWLPMFMFFNFTLTVLFCSLNMPAYKFINMVAKNNQFLEKKWQW